jgi:hypothetical protein
MAPLMVTKPEPNSDFFPRLDLGAEQARFLRREAHSFSLLPVERWDLAAALGERRVGFINDPRPVLTHNRFVSQGIGAQLRSGEFVPGSTAARRRIQVARMREQRLELEWSTGGAPVDWQLWFAEAMAVERDRHQGSMGVVDSAFYAGMERFMTTAGAPTAALSALRFQRAASTYNWADAAREVDLLIAERDRGTAWVQPAFFFDAAVIARLRSGDVAGARAAYARLANSSGRGPDDLRSLLLDAHVTAAERALNKGRPVAEKDKR